MTNTQALELARAYIQEHEPCDLSCEEDAACDFWFSGNAKANQHFHVFASRGDGSLLAVWKVKAEGLDGNPVVVLGGEGELAVIGTDVASAMAFMARLGGVDFLIFINVADDDVHAVDEQEDKDEAPVLEPDEEMAAWVDKTLHARAPKNLSRALIANMKAHPGLVKFARSLANLICVWLTSPILRKFVLFRAMIILNS
jgi:hypothetical protein